MNEIIKSENGSRQIEAEAAVIECETGEQAYIAERADGILGEIIAWVRDDRLSTKRAITSEAKSRAAIQAQHYELMKAYGRELQRNDLTNEQRADYLDKMNEAERSALRADEESRLFQDKQLAYSHGRSGQLLKYGAFVVACGIGGAAVYQYRHR